jgi:hypothetical protein
VKRKREGQAVGTVRWERYWLATDGSHRGQPRSPSKFHPLAHSAAAEPDNAKLPLREDSLRSHILHSLPLPLPLGCRDPCHAGSGMTRFAAGTARGVVCCCSAPSW